MDLLEKFIEEHRAALDAKTTPKDVWRRIEDDLCADLKTDMEDFIVVNRSELDRHAPRPELWGKIDEALVAEAGNTQKKTKHIAMWPRHILRIAASILLLLGGIGIGLQLGQTNKDQSEMAGLTHEQSQALHVFERDVQVKMQKAATFVNQSPEIKADLALLDEAALELKNDLKDVPPGNRAQVVHAMLENYKAKVHILERILKYNSKNDLQNNRNKTDKYERKEI